MSENEIVIGPIKFWKRRSDGHHVDIQLRTSTPPGHGALLGEGRMTVDEWGELAHWTTTVISAANVSTRWVTEGVVEDLSEAEDAVLEAWEAFQG